jgi:hypothetical protein
MHDKKINHQWSRFVWRNGAIRQRSQSDEDVIAEWSGPPPVEHQQTKDLELLREAIRSNWAAQQALLRIESRLVPALSRGLSIREIS